MVGVVFSAIMFEVTVSLIILSVRSHKGSLASLLILVEGIHSVQIDWLSPLILIMIHSHFVVMGFLGLKTRVSLHVISLGYGFVPVIDVFAMCYDGCYAKGLA